MRILFLSFLLALHPAICWAQTAVPSTPKSDDEIIIVGTRLPTPAAETGSSVTILTGEEIEAKAYQYALDALASVPGVSTNQNGSFGGLATVRIRGASQGHTLVLLDGVPIGDPTALDGGYDFSLFDPADIERIEVLKGAQSTLWGSDAIGGVINIITRKPNQGLGGRLFAEAGSFETYRGGGSVGGASARGDFRIAISRLDTEGISKADERDGNPEKDGYQGLTLSGRGGINLSDHVRLEAVLRHMQSDTDIDGFAPPLYLLGDTPDTTQTEQLTGNLTLKADGLGGALEHLVTFGHTQIEREGNFGGFMQIDAGERQLYRYQGTLRAAPHSRIAFGAEHEENQANGDDTSITGWFGLYELKPVSGLTLTAGLRLDYHSSFGASTTGRAAAAWAASDTLVLRGSWGQGFKAPTIFQLTQSFGALPANSDLQPETSEAFDLGVDWAVSQNLQLGLTYFDRDTENEITFALNARYDNLTATTASGVEFALDAALGDSLSLALGYTYIDAQNQDTGARQIRIPDHSGDVSLAFHNSGPLSAVISLRYNGAETEGQFGQDVDAWTRIDVSGAYRLSEKCEFYGRVENLADTDYQQVSGYGTPGRSGIIGVRLRF